MKRVPKVSKARAIEIAMNHNCVSREIAQKYTDSELREVLKTITSKSKFLKPKNDNNRNRQPRN